MVAKMGKNVAVGGFFKGVGYENWQKRSHAPFFVEGLPQLFFVIFCYKVVSLVVLPVSMAVVSV